MAQSIGPSIKISSGLHDIADVPGILRASFPLSYAPGSVNAWLLAEDEGWTVVDTGPRTPQALSFWKAAMARPIRGRPLLRIVATHHHTDHIGLAGWICRKADIPLHMSRAGYLTAHALRAASGGPAPDEALFRAAGCDADFLARLSRRTTYRASVAALPPCYGRLTPGRSIDIGGDTWRLMATEGHVSEQIVLHCPARNLLLSADQLLDTGLPMVVPMPFEPDGDPLAAFVASLHELSSVPAATVILPGHGEPFTDPHARIEREFETRARRLARLTRVCSSPMCAVEIARSILGRPLTDDEIRVVVLETIAQLTFLVARGAVDKDVAASGHVAYYKAPVALSAQDARNLLMDAAASA